MTVKSGLKDLSWMAGGAAVLIVATLLALHYHRQEDIAAKAALKEKRVQLVERMRAALYSASEAEKSAVMATTDLESQNFADQARAASAMVEETRDELGRLLEAGGTGDERDLLSRFSQAFIEFRQIDRELLDLAVRNTNLKAYALAFGPAADALAEMDDALSRILKESAASAAPQAKHVLLLAAGAQSGAWRIQSLLSPHIAEETDQKMDGLEARMENEDRKIRSDLGELGALLGSGGSDIGTATSSYVRYTELKTRILDLSRQNTNVRSLIISLNKKRMAVEMCQDLLAALERTIQDERLVEREPVMPR